VEPTNFGSNDKYYSDPHPDKLYQEDPGDLFQQKEEVFRKTLLQEQKLLPEIVFRTYKQWNQAIREALRNETGLRLSVGDKRQSVPVLVSDGFPKPIRNLLIDFDPNLLRLISNRGLLEQTVRGLAFIEQNFRHLGVIPRVETDWEDYLNVQIVEGFVDDLSLRLKHLDILKELKKIDTDILGAYFFRKPTIHLYWVVIGTYSALWDLKVENLTVVVLIHELAHAYTHLGFDIDDDSWHTEWFASTEIPIVEGFAQYYTERIVDRLDYRIPDLKRTFNTLLGRQSPVYSAYKDWIRDDYDVGEMIRAIMIHCRRHAVKNYTKFKRDLEEIKYGV